MISDVLTGELENLLPNYPVISPDWKSLLAIKETHLRVNEFTNLLLEAGIESVIESHGELMLPGGDYGQVKEALGDQLDLFVDGYLGNEFQGLARKYQKMSVARSGIRSKYLNAFLGIVGKEFGLDRSIVVVHLDENKLGAVGQEVDSLEERLIRCVNVSFFNTTMSGTEVREKPNLQVLPVFVMNQKILGLVKDGLILEND